MYCRTTGRVMKDFFFNLGSVVAEDYFGERMPDSKLVAMMEKSVLIFLV